jgi:hypothetical protein
MRDPTESKILRVPDVPVDLEAAIAGFARFYNCERYHEALGDVTRDDVLSGRRDEILRQRKEVQARTIADRKTFNQSRRSQPSPALY